MPLDTLLQIVFFNQGVLDIPQFTQFIRRTPMFQALEKAYVTFLLDGAAVELSSQTSGGVLTVKIRCREFYRQVSTLKQFCTSYLPLSTSENVYIRMNLNLQPNRDDDIENIPWLELLHLFTGVKNLHLSKDMAPQFVPSLQELVGRSMAEVLPFMQNISLEGIQPGHVLGGIETFIAARQLSGQPITVSIIPSGKET